MGPLLRAELIKLRTTRTFIALAGAAVVLSLIITVLAASLGGDVSQKDARDLLTSDFSGLFILILGVVGMAGEWRHRTITSTVLAGPHRIKLLSAKVLSYGVAGMAMSLAITLVILAVGTAILSGRGQATVDVTDFLDVLWRNLVVAGLAGAFGVCIGGLIRNQVVAIVGLVIFSFAIEPTLLGLVPDVGRFGPTIGAPSGIAGTDDDLLAPAVALMVMLGWVSLGFAATAILLKRRDLV